MQEKEIYLKIKREITKGVYNYDDQIALIAKWIKSEFELKKQRAKTPVDSVDSVSFTLRDKFSVEAMNAILINNSTDMASLLSDIKMGKGGIISERAYIMADFMIYERSRNNEI